MERSTGTKATSDETRLNRVQMARALREGVSAEDGPEAEQRMAGVERNRSADSGLRRVGARVTLGVLLASTLTGGRITALRADFLQHAVAGGGEGGSIPGSPGPSVGSDGQSHLPIQDTNQEQQKKMFSKLTGVTAAIAVGASVTVAGAQNAAVQWKVSEGGNGHWYKLDSVLRTWDDARLTSISLGGHLATIQSAAENAEVTSLSTTPPPGIGRSCWLGGQQLSGSCEPGCGWMWITGEPFDFQYWAPGEPNNITGSEDYLHIWVTDQWNDTGAAQTAESVIEWDADCNNDNIVDYGQCHDGTLPDYNGNNIPDCCDQGQACVSGHYPVQWRVEDGGNGHWYLDDPQPPLRTFSARNEEAAARGAHLATVTSQTEHAFVLTVAFPAGLLGPNDMWPALGGFRNAGSTQWAWVTGEPFVYAPFSPDPPNYDQTQWLMMWGIDLYTPLLWWTGNGNTTVGRAILEWSEDCNGDNIVDYGQILSGQLTDTNGNGIPNVCESTVTVPGSYATIQAAIDATPVGTARIIEVAAGTYPGPIDFKGRNVVVHGAGAGQTILAGTSGQSLSVVRFSGGEPATAALEAVTIRGGLTGTPIPGVPSALAGGGIFGIDSAASVRDCVVENNVAGFGAGMYFLRCSGEVRRTTVRNNTASSDGGGFQANQGSQRLTDVVIEANTCNSRGGGMHLVQGTPMLTRVTVRNNYSNNLIGGISWYALGSTNAMAGLDACAVTGNSALVTQGGIGISAPSTGTPAISLHGTNVCGNAPRPNVSGPWTNLGGNTICDCVSDLNLDGVVNGADMGLMLSSWGPCGTNCPYDLNADGQVNGADLGVLLSAWGTCGS